MLALISVELESPKEEKAARQACYEKLVGHRRSKGSHLMASQKNKKPEYELYIEEEPPDSDKPTCQVCHLIFIDYPSRNRHLMSAHNTSKDDKPSPQPPELVIDVEQEYDENKESKKPKKPKGICPSSRRKLSSYRSRCRFLKSSHKEENRSSRDESDEKLRLPAKPLTIPCLEPNCTSWFPFVQDLRNHLVIDHNSEPFNEAKFQFSTLEEFEDWKNELEEKTQCRWFKHHTKTYKLHRIFVYDCFNLLKYHNQGNNDKHCTSQIIVKAFKGRKKRLEVSYFEGHYGHGPLRLRKLGARQSNKRKRKSEGSDNDPNEEEDGRKNCHLCGKRFSNINSRNRHITKFHNNEKIPETSSGPIECLELNCGKKFRLRRFLRSHLIMEHQFEMHTGDVLHFSTLEEFENWKSKIEEETQSFYKKRQRDTNKTYKLTIQYVCCRSGKMFSTNNRKRNLKTQGSRRSNIHCTSEIKLRYLEEGFEVVYFKDHYGHDNSLIHLPVPKKVKQEIAEKLMAGRTVRSILREIRGSSGDHLNRKHLICKKDVDNIKAAHGIKTPRINSGSITNNVSSIDAWVKDTKTNFDGVILFYKPKDGHFEGLEESDFVVVCMTQFQRKMATKFGGDRICVDSSYDDEFVSVPDRVCELTTILVVNDYEEAIPVAFCLSSRVNMAILRLFFCSVRDAIGLIRCHTFVAIEDPQFHNAWCQTMGIPPCHFMCAWHIDAAWKSKLAMIPNKNKRQWIYERLKACQLQCDINDFTEMFESLLHELDMSEDTQEFCEYLNKFYTNRPEMWANAYRIGIKINTNLYLDNFHRIIRRSFMMGREKRKIEKCISAIDGYILDREYDQLVEYCRGKVFTKMNDIASRHENGIAMVPAVSTIIDSSCWAVSFSSKDVIYVVNKVENHRCDTLCAISCERCLACLKGYTCSCDDNAIKGNVCQHLHAVAEYQKSPEDAIQFIVIDGNDVTLKNQDEVMIDQSELMVDQDGGNQLAYDCIEVIDEDDQVVDEEGHIVDENDQIIDGYDEIIEEDDQIIDENDQIIDKYDDILDEDDQIIEEDDQIIYEDDQIIDEDDQIIDEDYQIIDDDDQMTDEDDQMTAKDDPNIDDDYYDEVIENDDNDDLTIDNGHSENECSGEPAALLVPENSESKNDLVSAALQLMGDLADFKDVPECVSDQVRKHIEMARKLLHKSLVTSDSR